MSAGEPGSYGSTTPVMLVTNKCVLPSTIDNTNIYCPIPRVVKIPCRLMLDAVLADLGYPNVKYSFDINEEAKVSAIVTFYSSALSPGNLVRPIKIAGIETDDSEIAEESAAKEGLKYIEGWKNLEIEDLHSAELGRVREDENDLHDQLQAVQGDKDNLKKELLLAANEMASCSQQISDLVAHIRTLGQGNESEGINVPLELFEKVASHLRCSARQTQKGVEDIPPARKSK